MLRDAGKRKDDGGVFWGAIIVLVPNADDFDWKTRLVLSVADKLLVVGEDCTPAVRQYRAAPDVPRIQKPELNATRTLNAWLAAHAKGKR